MGSVVICSCSKKVDFKSEKNGRERPLSKSRASEFQDLSSWQRSRLNRRRLSNQRHLRKSLGRQRKRRFRRQIPRHLKRRPQRRKLRSPKQPSLQRSQRSPLQRRANPRRRPPRRQLQKRSNRLQFYGI